MKKIAVVLTLLAVCAAGFIGYVAVFSKLDCDISLSVIPASENAAAFNQVKSYAANGQSGIALTDDISAYSLVTVTVQAKNKNLFAAEWIQLSVNSINGDVAAVSADVGPKDISSGGTGTFSVTYLTRNPSSAREGFLEYYVLGRICTVTFAAVS